MNRQPFQFAIVFLWLALPLVAYEYWRVWDRLPLRMASHFDGAGRPNGWTPRDGSFGFALGITAFLLVVFTVILKMIARRKVDLFAWVFLAFSYVIVGFVAGLNLQVIAYNLDRTPLHIEPLLIVVPAAVIILSVFYLGSKRGDELPVSDVLAQETHPGRAWALVFLPGLLGPLAAARLVPVTAVRFAMLLVAAILFAAMMMAWAGFRYRFLRHGVEVSALGYRLRSIPKQQIVSYAAEPWGPLRGYGIRGVGEKRAFVWGNKVVHIKTTHGDVYLGHSDPQRILRDLDLVTGRQTANSVPESAVGSADPARS